MNDSLNKPEQGRSETLTFQELPDDLTALQALPEAALDTPYKTAALTVAVSGRTRRPCTGCWTS